MSDYAKTREHYLEERVELLRAAYEERTASVIVTDNGQALACSASVAAAYGTVREDRERLRAEVAELKKNAERYRWLREFLLKADDTTFTFRPNVYAATAETIDEVIDAALGEENK